MTNAPIRRQVNSAGSFFFMTAELAEGEGHFAESVSGAEDVFDEAVGLDTTVVEEIAFRFEGCVFVGSCRFTGCQERQDDGLVAVGEEGAGGVDIEDELHLYFARLVEGLFERCHAADGGVNVAAAEDLDFRVGVLHRSEAERLGFFGFARERVSDLYAFYVGHDGVAYGEACYCEVIAGGSFVLLGRDLRFVLAARCQCGCEGNEDCGCDSFEIESSHNF